MIDGNKIIIQYVRQPSWLATNQKLDADCWPDSELTFRWAGQELD